MSRESDERRLAEYVAEQYMFDGPAPNACNGCAHPDCRENEREWEEMRAIAERIAKRLTLLE